MTNWHAFSTGEEISRPFQAGVLWFPEKIYGSGVTVNVGEIQSAASVSSIIEAARMETGEVNRYYRGIDSVYISKATKTNIDRTFHLEYLLCADDLLYDYLVDRRSSSVTEASSGTVHSLVFQVAVNRSGSTRTFYVLDGCKCKNVEKTATTGDAFKISADFSVSSAASYSYRVHSMPTDGLQTTGDICHFNVGASILADGSAIAYVTESISVTVNHNLKDLWTVGSRDKTNCIEGGMDITGTCDISLDDGGGYHYGDVVDANVAASIVIDTALATGAPKVTLTNVRWDTSSIDAASREPLMESAPFTAEQISVTEVT